MIGMTGSLLIVLVIGAPLFVALALAAWIGIGPLPS